MLGRSCHIFESGDHLHQGRQVVIQWYLHMHNIHVMDASTLATHVFQVYDCSNLGRRNATRVPGNPCGCLEHPKIPATGACVAPEVLVPSDWPQ
jgi:hypothetical protein